MSVKTGQNIITEGLIVHVDFNNFKSNGGKPTTNLAINQNTDPLFAISTPTLVNQGMTEDGWIQYGVTGQWTGGTYPYMFAIRPYPFQANVRYTTSCEIYTDIPKSMVTGDFSINYVNDVNMPSGGNLNRNQTDIHKPMKVYRRSFEYSNTNATWNQQGYFVFRGLGTPTFDPAKHHLFVRNVQIEQGDYPTPIAGKHRTRPDGALPYTSRSNANQDAMVNIAGSTYPVQFDSSFNWDTSSTSVTNGNVDFDNINRYPRFDSDTNSNVYFNGLSPSLMQYNENWAYEIWYKPDQFPNALATANVHGYKRKSGFLIGASSYNGHGIMWQGDENSTALKIRGFLRAPNYSSSADYSITQQMLGKWQHFALVHDATATYPSTLRFYINGEQFAAWGGSTTNSTYTGTTGLGRPMVDGGGEYNYRSPDGYVGEARVYRDRLLTADDVKRNYIATRNKYDYWRG